MNDSRIPASNFAPILIVSNTNQLAATMEYPFTTDYQQLRYQAGFVRLANHGVIQLTGQDRQAFLNSFCTADIKKLAVDSTTEAFILNEKGKCLLFAHVIALADRLLLVFHQPTVADDILAHLDKYLIREDVQLTDRSTDSSAWFVAGEQAEARLVTSGLLTAGAAVSESQSIGSLVLAQCEVAGDGFLVVADQPLIDQVETAFQNATINRCCIDALQSIRIEAVTPWFGCEVTLDNLPQELCRDHRAISFTKGCYLGQETVARLDALGRVNWLLRGIQTTSLEPPECPTMVASDGKTVIKVTSCAWSPEQNAWLAIGFVKRGFEKTGTTVGTWSVTAMGS